ncbi:helix-turn-helix domain-containing protein [Paractinoplanes maris]|uniref:helix-turn-helix domain-containing protein n=1 Tax=Paractinoplanes maris TaxID=1734446 RepID=UPI002020D746|nr:helix-turn-helix transcriptional regulator [Actinoplanes maris]
MPKNTAVNPTGVEIDGPKLRIRRKLSGQSMAAFAARCGVHVSYISHLERQPEPRRVSPEKFALICDALNIPSNQRHTMLTADAQKRAKAAA